MWSTYRLLVWCPWPGVTFMLFLLLSVRVVESVNAELRVLVIVVSLVVLVLDVCGWGGNPLGNPELRVGSPWWTPLIGGATRVMLTRDYRAAQGKAEPYLSARRPGPGRVTRAEGGRRWRADSRVNPRWGLGTSV